MNKNETNTTEIAKDGYIICLNGTEIQISNKYGILKIDDVADGISVTSLEKRLDAFMETHKFIDDFLIDNDRCIRKVVYDEKKNEYYQLQVILSEASNYWVVQEFDNELVYMGTKKTKCTYREDILDWLHANFVIDRCIEANVYRHADMDCANDGISSHTNELYILDRKSKGWVEPSDIRRCVYIEQITFLNQEIVRCKPAYRQNHWYMHGGNFLYSHDSRFREITGNFLNPIPIFDRCEE